MKTRDFLNSVVVAIIAIVYGLVLTSCSGNELEVEPKGGNGGIDVVIPDDEVAKIEILSSTYFWSDVIYTPNETKHHLVEKIDSLRAELLITSKSDQEVRKTVKKRSYNSIENLAQTTVYSLDVKFTAEAPSTELITDDELTKVTNHTFDFGDFTTVIKTKSVGQDLHMGEAHVIFDYIKCVDITFKDSQVKGTPVDTTINKKEYSKYIVVFDFEAKYSDNKVVPFNKWFTVLVPKDGRLPDVTVTRKTYQNLNYYYITNDLFTTFDKVIFYSDGSEDRTNFVRNLNLIFEGETEKIHDQKSYGVLRSDANVQKSSYPIKDGFYSGKRIEKTHLTYFDENNWFSSVHSGIDSLVFDDGDIRVNLGEFLETNVNFISCSQNISDAYEISKNNKKYTRYPSTLNFKGSVSKSNQIIDEKQTEINNSVLIDVEKEEIVEEFDYSSENLRQYQEGKDWYAEFTLITISSITGESRSQVKRNLNVSIVAQPELTKRQSTSAIAGAGKTYSTTERSFTDGDFSGKTMTTVYTFNYDGGNWNHNITAKYDDVVFTKGDLKVEMSKGLNWTVVYSDYAQSAATQVTVGGEVYNRYPSVLNYIGTFNGVSETVKQNVNIDVLVPFEKNIPAELGEILGIDVTKVVSSIVNNVPTFRVHVGVKGEHGVLSIMVDEINNNSFPTNKIYMYGIDINKPTGVVSAALKTNDSRGWIPANILINDGVDYRNGWTYKAYTDENYTQLIGQRVVNMMTGEKTPMINHSASKQADGSWIVKVNGSQVLRVK